MCTSTFLEIRKHDQIKYRFLGQILTPILQTDSKIAQLKVTLFDNVYKT